MIKKRKKMNIEKMYNTSAETVIELIDARNERRDEGEEEVRKKRR